MIGETDIVFDGPPAMPAPRFIEVEDCDGKSISFGEWVDREDGTWALRLPVTPQTLATLRSQVNGLKRQLAKAKRRGDFEHAARVKWEARARSQQR